MADWILIACLKQLFAEFDRIAPKRDHASDGSIGDTAHQHEVSDHNPDETGSVPIHDADHVNEVHAIDVDNDLHVPGLSMEDVVQFLLARCRSGKEKRLRYIIYNRRIWEADNGWKQRAYTGASAHTEHAHFSASYDSAKEASTASWHLTDLIGDDDMTPDELAAALESNTRLRKAFCSAVLNTDGVLSTPAGAGKASQQANPQWAAVSFLQNIYDTGVATRGYAATAAANDPAKFAAALVPLLPQGAQVTEEQLTGALVEALKQLAADDAPAA